MQRVSSAASQLDAMSPYKRPRPQSPHGPHGIFYSPPDHHHRFIAGGAHYSPSIYAAAPQRDVRQHVQEIPTLNYPDHHSRDVSPFGSLQSQIRRRPSLLSEFHGHGGAAERERERSKEFFSRNIDPSYRLHTSNHHPENDVIAAKRRRLDIDTKFRPVLDNNTATSRVVTSSANQPEVKKEPFIPKVENVSPTPCDDELPSSRVSKEGLLQSMEKMDREIQMVDNQIANLKKKKQELEQRAAQPREEEKAVADEDWEPKQENIIQLIYADNQRKADAAHKEMAKCAGPNTLPLYNQMSDIKNHQEVLKKNYELSRRFILYFKKQAAERSLREKSFCQLYHKRMEAWESRMEKIDADPKKKAKDAKTREFFEKQFPEIRKQREQQERFSRAGTRSWGNIARSDAELAEIVDGLNEQEANERHMRSLTVIPPMLFEKQERNVNYINKNGLVEDAMQEYKDRQRMNIWTDDEREIFREKYMQHPKNFGAIAQFLERKSVADCVLYYYQNKKRENYKQRKQQVRRKKPLPPKNTNTTVNRNQDDEDKDDKEDGTSQDPKKKGGGDNKDGLNGGSSQNGDASNGPPMSVPTNCALCQHSLDAYTMSRPLSKSNCELLGLNINEVTASMRVCSKCRFRSLRKSPCPVTSCKKARRKAKRLKPLPTKWLEISEDQRRIISVELGIGSEVTKCCPACFHRITRRLSNENGPEPDLALITRDAENEEDSVEIPDWSKKEISALKQALRKYGKNWSEVARVVGTKEEGKCREVYDTYRQKHHLDQILADYEKEKMKREHRVSVAESLGSTITAPSDNEVPSSDGENDADESSDTASASENEDGNPFRNRGKGLGAESKKTDEKGSSVTKSDTPTEPVVEIKDSALESARTVNNGAGNDLSSSAMRKDTGDSNEANKADTTSVTGAKSKESSTVGEAKIGESLENVREDDNVTNESDAGAKPPAELEIIEGTRGPPVSKPALPGEGTGIARNISADVPTSGAGDQRMEVDPVRTEPKPEDDGGDTSATCSADEGNPMDVDVAFSESSKPSGSLPQKPARSRVSSSEDDTKLSELKAKLEVARTDTPGSLGEVGNDPTTAKEGAVASELPKKGTTDQQGQKQQQPLEEAKSWGSHGILNMRDLIDSAIHKHLGQEEPGKAKTPAAKDQEAMPIKTTEVSKAGPTQSTEKPAMTKPAMISPVASGPQTPYRAPARKTPTPDRSEVKLIEPSPPQAPTRTSHITHTSMQDRDIYEVSSTHRPGSGHRSPGHRSPGKRLTSPAGYMDPLQSRLLEGAHGANHQGLVGTIPHPSGIIPRGASPRGGPSPHAPERDHQLHSPSGRHNYSPRSSATASPYALIPASDRHHPSAVAGQAARALPRSKQTSVPPPPPLINKLSPMTVKQEKHSPSGGVHCLAAHAGSISQGTPIGYMPRPDMAAVRFEAPGVHKAQNDRLMMLARAHSPATSSPQYTGGSITQGTPLSRRDPPCRPPHERLMGKESVHPKDVHHQKAPRVKVEQPPGPEKGGWGIPMVSPYDGTLLSADILKSLSDREVALKMAADPAMLYMYTQRHLMQYGGEYGPGLVRGQYASEAYTSSKATLADDFATAQRMPQRMPLPTTSAAPSNPRQSPRQEAAVSSAKRGSPAGHHPPHPMDALPPGIPFAPFGLPHQQGGYIMVAPHQYMQGMTVATGPHPIPHLFTTMAPTHPSPRSPHTQGAIHPLHQDPKNHSPTVRAAPSPSDAKPRLWQQNPAVAGGHFKTPVRGLNPAAAATVLMGPSPHHPFGLPVQRAPIPGGSIMQGTPMWKQQATAAASITSGTPNPELRDSRKPDRGPSPLPPKSQGSAVRRGEAQRMAEYSMARKEHPAGLQHENEVTFRGPQQVYGVHRQYYCPQDVRRPPHHQSSGVIHESHPHHPHQQQHQPPKRPPNTSHPREQHQPPPQAHQERRPPTREGEPSHLPQPAHYPQERRLKTERVDMEGGKGKANNATDLLATMFEKDPVRSGGKNVKAEHGEAGKTGFTAASLIDHIIHQSINRPSDEEVAQAEMKNSSVPTATTASVQPQPSRTPSSQPGHHHQPPPSSISQNTGRMASNLIDQLIVQQIKHETPEEEKPVPRPSSQGNPHQKGGGHRDTRSAGPNYERGSSSSSGHKSNHIDSTVSSIPQGQYRPVPILGSGPHTRISIGDHINAIVTKGYSQQSLQKASNVETVDSTTAHRGVERTIMRGENEVSYSKTPRVANDVHSKGSRTVSPAMESSRAADSSTVMNYSKRLKPDHMEFREESARMVQHSVSSSMREPKEGGRAPTRDCVRTMDPSQLPGGYQGRVPHSERDFARGQIPRSEGTLSRTPGAGHRLPPGVTPVGYLPPHSAVKQQLPVSSYAAVNYSREGITSGRPINFQESINRMIERQVRANDVNPVEEAQGRWAVSRGYEPIRPGADAYKRNLTIAQLQGQSNGPPKGNSRAEMVANKENSVHSTPIASSAPGIHPGLPPPGMPPSSHPGMVPAGYAYPVLAFMPNHQPTPHGIHHGSSPSLLATVPRASPNQAPPGPRRENNPHHAPILSSEYECLSDDE